jgi:hypothetical protein
VEDVFLAVVPVFGSDVFSVEFHVVVVGLESVATDGTV